MPKISLGEPLANDRNKYEVIEKDAIKIYFSSVLNTKRGGIKIKIKLRKLFFLKWLALET